jgi:hypothetical protein
MECPKCGLIDGMHQYGCSIRIVEDLETENLRLRAALEKIRDIVETDNTHTDGHKFDYEDRAYYDGLRVCAAIAREALEKKITS